MAFAKDAFDIRGQHQIGTTGHLGLWYFFSFLEAFGENVPGTLAESGIRQIMKYITPIN